MKYKQLLSYAAMTAATTMTSHGAASLIAHYTFDADTTTATVGTNGTAGLSASHTSTTGEWAVGGGALSLDGTAGAAAGNAGVVGGDSFAWADDRRVIAFWMKGAAQSSAQPPTMISLGSGAANGGRFDVNLTGGSDNLLRAEVQGGGTSTTVNLLTNTWLHVAIVVNTNGANLSNTTYFVHDQLGASVATANFTDTRALITGTGPLRIGDSYQGGEREFNGLIDDVRLYNDDGVGAFTFGASDAQALALQFGTVPEPSSTALLGLGGLALILRRRK